MGPLGSTGYMHKKKTESTIDPGFNLTSGTSTEQTHESSTIGVIASQYTNSTTNTYADPYPCTGNPEVVTTKLPRLHAHPRWVHPCLFVKRLAQAPCKSD